MHRGTPDGHITSEKPEHNCECRRVLRHVLALELHRALPFETLKLASPLPGASAAK